MEPRRLRRSANAGVLLLTFTLAAACGDDGGGTVDDAGAETTTTTSTASTSTTQPDAAGNLAPVQPYIEELLAEWDEHMTVLTAQPEEIADDPDHPDLEAASEIFTEESPYYEALPRMMREVYIAQDVGVRPGPDGQSQHATFLGFTDGGNDRSDLVSFVYCTYHDGTAFTLSTGEDQPPSIGVRQGGGEAMYVDGQWRLHQMFQLGSQGEPAGTPNPCPDMAQPEANQ